MRRRFRCPLAPRHLLILILFATGTGCTSLQRLLPARFRADERMASSITIVRDEWGVPTIYAPSDAAAAFGIAYAQAEDNYWQIEEDYIHALGRVAHYYGERFLAADLLNATLDVERLSRAEYEREPVERQALWDAFAEGLNYYVRTRQAQPRLIPRFEPWMVFAHFRALAAGTIIDGVRLGAPPSSTKLDDSYVLAGTVIDSASTRPQPVHASSAWAVAPGRTAAGHPLLLHREYTDFSGSQPYELHVHTESGWHFRGVAALGTPVPYAGHNEQLGWAHTRAAADVADLFEVTFDHPTDSLQYRYGGEWRRAEPWADTLFVNTQEGVETRVYRFLRTHHGPIVARHHGKAFALRIARFAEGGALQQWYAMNRAASLAEFQAALNLAALPHAAITYADRAGNIMVVHGNAVPARDTTLDWTRPVDGSTSRSEWRGYHAVPDLPQLLNPAWGWLQHEGGTPYRAAADDGNPERTRFPLYMSADAEDARARTARRSLGADSAWTLDAWTVAVFDTRVANAETAIAQLVREWENVGGTNPDRAMALDEMLDKLRAWDHIGTAESVEMTWFVLWQENLRSGTYTGAFSLFRALEDVLAQLQRDWQSALVPWGEINRLQRNPRGGEFADERPSLPLAAGPAWLGTSFNASTRPQANTRRRYAYAGSGWLSVTEFAPEPRTRSIAVFGQSAEPASPHFFDQAALFSSGRLRTAWFNRDDILAHARRIYSPAGPAPGAPR